VRFLSRLLWQKDLVFFPGGRECMTLVGHKCLTQGSVLSPFLYNMIWSCADRFIPSGCGFLQYADADDLVVYMAHKLLNVAHAMAMYATKNSQTIIKCRSHQTQCILQSPVLNPFQTHHVCLCHIRKTNLAIFQDRSNESLIQQYQTNAPQEAPAIDFNKFNLWRHLLCTYFTWQLDRNPSIKKYTR
jgi:hypothetical protein